VKFIFILLITNFLFGSNLLAVTYKKSKNDRLLLKCKEETVCSFVKDYKNYLVIQVKGEVDYFQLLDLRNESGVDQVENYASEKDIDQVIAKSFRLEEKQYFKNFKKLPDKNCLVAYTLGHAVVYKNGQYVGSFDVPKEYGVGYSVVCAIASNNNVYFILESRDEFALIHLPYQPAEKNFFNFYRPVLGRIIKNNAPDIISFGEERKEGISQQYLFSLYADRITKNLFFGAAVIALNDKGEKIKMVSKLVVYDENNKLMNKVFVSNLDGDNINYGIFKSFCGSLFLNSHQGSVVIDVRTMQQLLIKDDTNYLTWSDYGAIYQDSDGSFYLQEVGCQLEEQQWNNNVA